MKPAQPLMPQRGTSLIEALVVLAIFSLAMLTLLQLQTTLQLHQELAHESASATLLAERELEHLQSLAPSHLPPDGEYAFTLPTREGHPTAFTVTRQLSTTHPGWRALTLTVRWQDRSLTEQILQWHSAYAAEPDGWGALALRAPSGQRALSPHVDSPGENPAAPASAAIHAKVTP